MHADPNSEFNTWFQTAMTDAQSSVQKGAKSIIILTIWILWKARNDAIFKNIAPNRQDMVVTILDEANLWMTTGARALYTSYLCTLLPMLNPRGPLGLTNLALYSFVSFLFSFHPRPLDLDRMA
jgi:hypothetical protein